MPEPKELEILLDEKLINQLAQICNCTWCPGCKSGW